MENTKRVVDDGEDAVPNEVVKKLKANSSDISTPPVLCSSDESEAIKTDGIPEVDSESVATEADVGISEYIGDHSGFSGVIKQRYSDFLVSEVDLNGTVLKLDSLECPVEECCKLPDLKDVFSDDAVLKLKQLSSGESTEPVVIEVVDKSKDERRVMHELVAKEFPDLSSYTEDREERKVVVIIKSRNASNRKEELSRKRQRWPSFRGDYTHFVLYKENIDTMEAVNLISFYLRGKKSFTYAGVKDKRAKTVQRVSAYRTSAEELLSLNKRLKRIVIGNIQYVNQPLRLGDLLGNKFRIILRNVSGDRETIERAMHSLSEKGFLNYFGMQRFGTTTVPTYAIGLAILKSDWKTAVHLILKPRSGEDETMSQCRNLWNTTQDATQALSVLKRKNCVEARLLKGLQKHGMQDLVNALNFIPRNQRLMYVHSYQSWLWNRILSKRIQKYGLQVLKGDLQLKTEDGDFNGEEPSTAGKQRPVPVPIDSIGDDSSSSIEDVVLPLFGHDVVYPDEIADWYRDMLKEDGLDMDHLQHRIQDYSLPGFYRHMVVRIKELKWSALNYDDPNVPLLISDWEALQDPTLQEATNTSGTLRALKMELILPRSCYATMALREVLRKDTSAAFQSTQNVT